MKKRLLLEGSDDHAVVGTLLYNHDLDAVFDLKPKKGVSAMLETLGDELEATDFDALGIVLDADADPSTHWGRISATLTCAGYQSVPVAPDTTGTIVVEDELPPVGVWIMPNNSAKGAIEDFMSSLITPEDPLWPKAQADVAAIPKEDRLFKESYHSKACIHTWLAWQEEPGTRMGEVFRKNYLDPKHPNAGAFVSWLRRLLAAAQQGGSGT